MTIGGIERTPQPVTPIPAKQAVGRGSSARGADGRAGAVGETAPPPDLQVALHYLAAVHDLLEWAPAGLVPMREAILA